MKCVFAGTFDPVTIGHENVIKKASELFDEVVVAICVNRTKSTMFSLETRLNALNAVCLPYKNVKVTHYEGFLVDFMRENGIKYNLRGVRSAVDYEYETAMYEVNSALLPDAVTLYLPCETSFRHVSSTLVREMAFYGKDFSAFVPTAAREILENDVKKR